MTRIVGRRRAIGLSVGMAVSVSGRLHAGRGATRRREAQLGVFVGNEPERVTQFERWLGRPVDGVLGYTAGQNWDDIADPGWAIALWAPIDRPVYWSVPLIPETAADLRLAAAGAYNMRYRSAATRLALFRPRDRHLHIRTGWEFNTTNFQWAARGRERAFVGAFRHFVDSFRAVSDRFLFEWNMNLDGNMEPEAAYPGDAHVDVIGMDFYWNPRWTSTDPVRAWDWMLNHRRGLRWHQDFAASHRKPTAYSEWGVTTDDAEPYLERAKAWFDSHEVLFHTYWDSDSAYPGRLSDGKFPHSAAAFRRLFSGAASGTVQLQSPESRR